MFEPQFMEPPGRAIIARRIHSIQYADYVKDELESRMRVAAQAANLSHSRWLANLIRERLAVQWPEDVAALASAWRDPDDFPEADSLRANLGKDAPRERL